MAPQRSSCLVTAVLPTLLLLLLVARPCEPCFKCTEAIAVPLKALLNRMEIDRPFIRTKTYKGVQNIISKLLGEHSKRLIYLYEQVEQTMGSKFVEMNNRIGDVSGQLSEKHYAIYWRELVKLWKDFQEALKTSKEPSCPVCEPTYISALRCESCQKENKEVCLSYCERTILEKQRRAPLEVLDDVDPDVIPEPDYDPEFEPTKTSVIALIVIVPAMLCLIVFCIVMCFTRNKKSTSAPDMEKGLDAAEEQNRQEPDVKMPGHPTKPARDNHTKKAGAHKASRDGPKKERPRK
nr:uncharacterized protein LOC116938953 isoform X2 [Petromyzon marinus]